MEPVAVDDAVLKALASPTRRTLLRSLRIRRKTLSELSREHRLSISSVKKHLVILSNAGLIHKYDDGRKWKYYELTRSSLGMLSDDSIVMKLLLTVPILVLFLTMSAVQYAVPATPPVNPVPIASVPLAEVDLPDNHSGEVFVGPTGSIEDYPELDELEDYVETPATETADGMPEK